VHGIHSGFREMMNNEHMTLLSSNEESDTRIYMDTITQNIQHTD